MRIAILPEENARIVAGGWGCESGLTIALHHKRLIGIARTFRVVESNSCAFNDCVANESKAATGDYAGILFW